MKTTGICCDICKKALVEIKDYRQVSLIKRENADCIVDVIWDFDLCQKCALSLEQEIRRRMKIQNAK